MASNPFVSVSDVTRKIGKNYYDWSHDYNLTGKIGTIYPVFAKYCPAGTSLSVDAIAGLQFMPMQFPVQSKMKMKLSFWRMPLRAMWKDYTNLVSSQNQSDVQKNYVAPYIDFNHSGAYTDMLCTGGLCDYLRIPVTSVTPSFSFNGSFEGLNLQVSKKAPVSDFTQYTIGQDYDFTVRSDQGIHSCIDKTSATLVHLGFGRDSHISPSLNTSFYRVVLDFVFVSTDQRNSFVSCVSKGISNVGLIYTLGDQSAHNVRATLKCDSISPSSDALIATAQFTLLDGDITYSDNSLDVYLQLPTSDFCFSIPSNPSTEDTHPRFSRVACSFTVPGTEVLNKDTSPYFDSSSVNKDKQLKLSAYPFRMYEAIYNSYIRYIRNNPFRKDGKAVYNEWLPTMDGGPDTTPYKLYRCNWAADAYTTAVQSPQQGVAPVVGLSQATVTAEDGVSRVVPAITTEDGRVYGIEFKANEFGLEGVDYTELGTGAKVAPVHSMYALAQSGISIEDFRMTNAYQRYLELNMMRGYSYKQIVEGRFEVNVKYDDLLMPEFCGGMTRDIFMSGVQQNVEDNGGSGSYIGSLGSEAGVAGCRGDLGHKVKIYCDEASYVMCLAYVVPQSIYSQVCPKDFLYRDLLDAWSPEFDQIGFQPIKYSELCPVEAWNTSPDRLSQTFGFQRPWYEYCEVLDASVGLFNTELRNFLMHRMFSSVPVLGEKFTTVNPESVDHVFSVTEFTDKFFGQIHFSIDVKSPVSRVVIPSLE